MSSVQLGSGFNTQKGNLGGAFDILSGASGDYTDLGIARRFGGAAAAYSLRDIGAMNGRVVKVRRDVDGQGSDPEEDFSANQVQSGALEDWVNGKLENTLPADVATAAAAFSLRKVKNSYSGNAVRIRRTSDSVEVNVAFDSDSKVSSSSSISTVSGSTTATDLNGFLNESVSGFTSVPYSGINASYKNFTSDPTISDTAFSGTNGGTQSRLAYLNTTDAFVTASDFDGCKVKVTGTVNTLSGGDLTVKPSTSNNGGGSWTPPESNKVISDGTTGSFEYIFTGDGTNGFRSVLFLIDASTTVNVSNLTFEYIEHGATVHTWYDQAGSNDATKITSTNQPKIAENGALLADGIKFNGSTTSLSTGTQVLTGNETGSQSIYTVCNVTDGSSGYIAGSADDDSSGKIGQSIFYYTVTDVFALTNGSTATDTTVDRISAIRDKNILVSFNYNNNNNNTLNQNANQNGYSNGTDAYNFEAGSNFIIGARGGTVQAGRAVNGSIQEVIAYNSDQSDNRFKIESNINNYYGLYNDANDLTQSTWQNTGGETFSSTSTDGFSFSNSSGTAFIGVTLSETLALNDSVFVSFNASGVTHPASSDQSPQVRLRDSVSGGSGTSPINQVTNGFNAYELEYTSGSSGQHIVFSEGDTAGGTVTISNFKVSRIARNGFVETWYDQSDNGNNATQATAGNQPAIVQNGGICTSNSSPSVFFTGDTRDDELDFTDLTLTDATIFTVVNIDSSADQQIILGGSVGTGNGVMMPMMDNGSSNTQVYKNSTVGGAEQGSSQFKNGAQITLADRDDAFDNLAVNSQILFTMVDVDVAEAKVLDGISRTPSDAPTFHLQGQMNELIIYNSDLSSDRGTIESEIANHYNITLS